MNQWNSSFCIVEGSSEKLNKFQFLLKEIDGNSNVGAGVGVFSHVTSFRCLPTQFDDTNVRNLYAYFQWRPLL